MKTQYNLRAWHKIENEIGREINSLSCDLTSVVSISRYSQDVRADFDKSAREQHECLEKLFELNDIRKQLRDGIRKENIGDVDAAISQKKHVENKIQLVNGVLRNANEVRPVAINTYYDEKKTAMEGTATSYGSRFSASETIGIPMLTEELVEVYKDQRSKLKKEIRELEDRLLILNTSKECELLSAEQLAFLGELDIV